MWQIAKCDFYVILGGQGYFESQYWIMPLFPLSNLGKEMRKKTSALSHNCLAMGTELCHCPQSLVWGRRYTATLNHNCLATGTANVVALFVDSR